MASKVVHYPKVISVPRVTTLLVSLLVSLSSGAYVYSAYAPQLGARLNITHTQLNIVGLAGILGIYMTGPIWGRIVDARGPRIPMASAFALSLTGYAGTKLIFDAGVPGSGSISFIMFCVLTLCGYIVGAGGHAGMMGAMNATARTFPDKSRATATGLVISGIGLSAFLYSTIFRIEFAGNTSSFLGFLALGTSVPLIAGFFFIKPIPLPPSDNSSDEEGTRTTRTGIGTHDGNRDRNEQSLQVDDSHNEGEHSALLAQRAETTPQLSRRAALSRGLPPNVYGRKLFTSTDFWLLFLILSILAGTGLMYINNVGLMSQALYISSAETYDPIAAARWQVDQVASISLSNFSGRIVIGLTSDYAKHRLSLPRSFTLVLVSFLFFISQLLASLVISSISYLWIASATLGLAHGSLYSLFPNVCLEWFGIPHFSENWGYLSISPVVFGNIFSVLFGHNLDMHSPSPPPPPSFAVIKLTSISALPPSDTCTLGRECYVDALYLTLFGCFLAILLSVWTAWRDRRKLQAASRRRRGICE